MSLRSIRSFVAGALLFLFAGMPAVAAIGVALQMQLGNPSGATANATDHRHYLIQRTVEAIDYDDETGEANWVSWDLTASDVGSSGRSPSFITDITLPPGFYQVTSGDYTNSGFNRGHLCPSADRTANDTDNALVFYMSNILPQTADNNQGPWAGLEAYCRTLAASGNELLIIAGGSGYSGSYIASRAAAIPGYLWKIVVVVPSGSGTALSRINGSTRVIAVKIPNVSGVRNDPWTQYVTSASQIQVDTGYSFFTALPSPVAAVLRDKVDGVTGPLISSLSPASGVTGTQVVISGSGFSGASGVSFAGTGAFFVVNSDSQITATAPVGVVSGSVAVTTPGGVISGSAVFAVIKVPAITSFSPTGGGPGSVATITGSGFAGASAVIFQGAAATFTVNSDTQIMAAVPAGATSGPLTVATAYGSATSSGSYVVDTSQAPRLVISQIYGAGGNSGAVYKFDFIAVYNAGNAAADLNSCAVQYAGATGTTWQATPLRGILLPGRYCLVQEAQGAGGSLNLPTPQIIGTINLSASGGKVALTNTPTLLTGGSPIGNPALLDFVGYGSADSREGTGAAPQLSSTTSAMRANLGGTDTDDNAADFIVSAPLPDNGSRMDAWRARAFTTAELSVPAFSGDLANPSGDSMNNVAKYAFNLDPHDSDGRSAVKHAFTKVGNSCILTLTHRRSRFAADITFTYEVSSDLITWTALSEPPLSVVALDAATDLVSLSLTSTVRVLYLRLKASR